VKLNVPWAPVCVPVQVCTDDGEKPVLWPYTFVVSSTSESQRVLEVL
jgi:hypothetical protein